MGKVYCCDHCEGREFILDNEDIIPGNPKFIAPYCPYCGRKAKILGWGKYEITVHYVRDND